MVLSPSIELTETVGTNGAFDSSQHLPVLFEPPQPRSATEAERPTEGETTGDIGASPAFEPMVLAEVETAKKRHTLATIIARNPQLVLTVLSFIADRSSYPFDALLEAGPKRKMFEILFDLYDVGLIRRAGVELQITVLGSRVLERLGLP